jgi:hypothetical protein
MASVLVLMLGAVVPAGAQSSPPAGPQVDADAIEANPGRPTVSTPAALTPQGYVQFESGLLGAEASGEFSNRTGIEEVVKFSPFKRLEFLVQTEPLAYADIGNAIISQPGEVFAGFQTVLAGGDVHKPTLAVSYFRRLYASPAPELDMGTNRQSALLLFSFEVKKFHVDTNGIVTEQITDLRSVHRAQFGQTLSVSHDLAHKFGMSGELWHFSQPFLRGNAAGLLLAPTYTARPNLVFDGGFNRGLTSTSTRWEIFLGFTYLLPKKLL